jgi:hypothetical protein
MERRAEGRIESLDGKTREGWVGGGAGARRAEMGRTDNGGVDSFPTVAGFGRGLNEASMSASAPLARTSASFRLACDSACFAITDASFGSWSSLSLSPSKPGSEDARLDEGEGEGLGERARRLFPGIVPAGCRRGVSSTHQFSSSVWLVSCPRVHVSGSISGTVQIVITPACVVRERNSRDWQSFAESRDSLNSSLAESLSVCVCGRSVPPPPLMVSHAERMHRQTDRQFRMIGDVKIPPPN